MIFIILHLRMLYLEILTRNCINVFIKMNINTHYSCKQIMQTALRDCTKSIKMSNYSFPRK